MSRVALMQRARLLAWQVSGKMVEVEVPWPGRRKRSNWAVLPLTAPGVPMDNHAARWLVHACSLTSDR